MARPVCIRTSPAPRRSGRTFGIESTVSMDDPSQYTRATILARDTVERLQREGHSADEAKRMVVAMINAEEFAVMKGRHTFDETRFIERLHQLPD